VVSDITFVYEKQSGRRPAWEIVDPPHHQYHSSMRQGALAGWRRLTAALMRPSWINLLLPYKGSTRRISIAALHLLCNRANCYYGRRRDFERSVPFVFPQKGISILKCRVSTRGPAFDLRCAPMIDRLPARRPKDNFGG
jgi:hypothetical protein